MQGWAQRDSSHPGEGDRDSLSPGRGRQLEEALGCLTGLQARNSWGWGVLYPSPIPHSVCLRRQQGSETLATLRLPGHSPETISVTQEGTSEAKSWSQVHGWGWQERGPALGSGIPSPLLVGCPPATDCPRGVVNRAGRACATAVPTVTGRDRSPGPHAQRRPTLPPRDTLLPIPPPLHTHRRPQARRGPGREAKSPRAQGAQGMAHSSPPPHAAPGTSGQNPRVGCHCWRLHGNP